MLTVLKKNGATSTAEKVTKKGPKGVKGRLELFAEQADNGTFRIHFVDYGRYGKVRWEADFGTLSREQIENLAADLQALADGQFDNTHILVENLRQEPDVAEALEVSTDSQQTVDSTEVR